MREPARDIVEQLFLAAEEMRGAGDVEEEAIRAALLVPRRDRGRIARRPQREPPQRRVIGGGIGIVHLERTGFGARIRERIADQETFRLGRRIHGGDAGNAGGIDHKNEGPGGINRRG